MVIFLIMRDFEKKFNDLIPRVDISQPISIKRLSDADIGRSTSSNQTHIGLFEDTVPLEHIGVPSLFIFCDSSADTITIIDPIDDGGSGRSPKMRSGRDEDDFLHEGIKYNSTYKTILDTIDRFDRTSERSFYLLWATMTNGRLVFVLYTGNDSLQKKYNLELPVNRKKYLIQTVEFSVQYEILNNIIADLYDSDEKLEEISKIEAGEPTNSYFTEKESDFIKEIGDTGESLINEYLKDLKKNGEILDFYWLSKDYPGADHDFEITELDETVSFIEVKSTVGKFKKNLYWSRNERNLFIANHERYKIFRVSELVIKDYFKKGETKVYLTISDNMSEVKKCLDSIMKGLSFDKSIVSPSKIDIHWKNKTRIDNYYSRL